MKAHKTYPTNKQTWVKANDQGDGSPTPHSGGEGQQFRGGFDARNRVIAQPNGVNRTPDIISRPGNHVPAENKPEIVKGIPSVNDGPMFRSSADLPKVGWKGKGYKTK